MTHLMLKLFLALIRHIYDDAYSLRWLMKGSDVILIDNFILQSNISNL